MDNKRITPRLPQAPVTNVRCRSSQNPTLSNTLIAEGRRPIATGGRGLVHHVHHNRSSVPLVRYTVNCCQLQQSNRQPQTDEPQAGKQQPQYYGIVHDPPRSFCFTHPIVFLSLAVCMRTHSRRATTITPTNEQSLRETTQRSQGST